MSDPTLLLLLLLTRVLVTFAKDTNGFALPTAGSGLRGAMARSAVDSGGQKSSVKTGAESGGEGNKRERAEGRWSR